MIQPINSFIPTIKEEYEKAKKEKKRLVVVLTGYYEYYEALQGTLNKIFGYKYKWTKSQLMEALEPPESVNLRSDTILKSIDWDCPQTTPIIIRTNDLFLLKHLNCLIYVGKLIDKGVALTLDDSELANVRTFRNSKIVSYTIYVNGTFAPHVNNGFIMTSQYTDVLNALDTEFEKLHTIDLTRSKTEGKNKK